MGLSLPWLVGIAVLIVVVGWYLFAPERSSTIDSLAFGDENGLQPEVSAPKPSAHVDSGFGMPQAQQADLAQVVEVIGGVRSYAETNRTAVERLAQSFKAQTAQMAALQEQMKEAQAQISVLSARLSSLEAKPRATPRPVVKSASPVTSSSPLTGMRLNSVQVGMAWVYWQDKTWAVQVGDSLGPVIVTAIDADSRQVHTSAGTIK
jgi:intracellular multiplication protein IcmG